MTIIYWNFMRGAQRTLVVQMLMEHIFLQESLIEINDFFTFNKIYKAWESDKTI